MVNLLKKVNLKPIDPDKLHFDKVEGKELYTFDLPLDSTPDPLWVECFEREYSASLYTRKRKIEVEGDRLVAVTAENELKGRIEWIRRLINQTNNWVEEYNKEIKQKEEEKKAEERKAEAIRKMKESLKEK